VICPERINPIIKKILPLIPQPNLTGELNNYFASAGILFDRWTIDSKINLLWRPTCPQSMLAAQKLAGMGYSNVKTYEGGLEEWNNTGHRIERLEQAGAV
jgi:hypothetical protein